MFHDYPSFLNIFYSSLIFWSFSPSQSSLFGQFVVTVDFHAIWRWITESGTPCRKDFTFQQVLLVFPFHGSRPQLISIEQRHPLLITFFDFSVHASSERIICLQFIIATSLFISWSPLVGFLPCYVMAFCSHLASFPQSN